MAGHNLSATTAASSSSSRSTSTNAIVAGAPVMLATSASSTLLSSSLTSSSAAATSAPAASSASMAIATVAVSSTSATNNTWSTHMQVPAPACVVRQPQLAHLANERPMARSPLTWHTHATAHTEAALYNYMAAATHKTPLDINPLLPAFVRAPHNTGNSTAPFVGGSVDLSLGSSVRNTSAQSSSGSSNNNQTQSSKNRQNPSSAPASNKHAATSSFLGGSDTTPFGSCAMQRFGNQSTATNTNINERCPTQPMTNTTSHNGNEFFSPSTYSTSLAQPTAPPVASQSQCYSQRSNTPPPLRRTTPVLDLDRPTLSDPLQLIREVLHSSINEANLGGGTFASNALPPTTSTVQRSQSPLVKDGKDKSSASPNKTKNSTRINCERDSVVAGSTVSSSMASSTNGTSPQNLQTLHHHPATQYQPQFHHQYSQPMYPPHHIGPSNHHGQQQQQQTQQQLLSPNLHQNNQQQPQCHPFHASHMSKVVPPIFRNDSNQTDEHHQHHKHLGIIASTAATATSGAPVKVLSSELNHSTSSCSSYSSASSSSSSSLLFTFNRTNSLHDTASVSTGLQSDNEQQQRRRCRKPKKTSRATSNTSDNEDESISCRTNENNSDPRTIIVSNKGAKTLIATESLNRDESSVSKINGDSSLSVAANLTTHNSRSREDGDVEIGNDSLNISNKLVATGVIEGNESTVQAANTMSPSKLPMHNTERLSSHGKSAQLYQQPQEQQSNSRSQTQQTNQHAAKEPTPNRRKSPSKSLFPGVHQSLTTPAATINVQPFEQTSTNPTQSIQSNKCESVASVTITISDRAATLALSGETIGAILGSQPASGIVAVAQNSNQLPVNGLGANSATDSASKVDLQEENIHSIAIVNEDASYKDVETKLAEMFAGMDDAAIDDDGGDDDANDADYSDKRHHLDETNEEDADDAAATSDDEYQPDRGGATKRPRQGDNEPIYNASATPDTPVSMKISKRGRPKGSTNKVNARKATSTPKPTDARGTKRARKKHTSEIVLAISGGAATQIAQQKQSKPNTKVSKNKSKTGCASEPTVTTTTRSAAVPVNVPCVIAPPRFGPCVHVRSDGSSNVINGNVTGNSMAGSNIGGGGAAASEGRSGGATGSGNGTTAGLDGDHSDIYGTKSGAKGKLNRATALGFTNSADRSTIRGLHLSTLSTKYDADTTDTTWMCVFCKQGPHSFGLGDLFGPYLVRTAGEEFEHCVATINADGTVPSDEDQMWRRKAGVGIQKRTLLVSVACGVLPATMAKNKLRKHLDTSTEDPDNYPPSNPIVHASTLSHQQAKQIPLAAACVSASLPHCGIFAGMTRTAPDAFEVWMHGDCTVWSPGVHIVGSRIVGLESAVWTAARHRCSVCEQHGAMMACLQRGCERQVHVPCGRNSGWTLCESDFKTRCAEHSVFS